MRKGFRKYLALLVFMALTLLFGCGTYGEGEEAGKAASVRGEKETEEEAIQIGLSVDSFVIERWVRDRDVFVAEARKLGAEVNVQDAGGDSREQISQIEYLIDKDMDAIVVVARDCAALVDVVKKARDAGIPVISYDRMIYNANSDLYVSFDNRQVGVLMAEALKEAIPEGGEIFMIQGSLDDDNVYQVKEGFEETLKGSSLEVVYTASCEGWLAENAIPSVEEALELYPEVKGIMCGNDDIASQVIQVLAEKQLAGKVAVVGQDGDVAACQRIVEGTQYMTAFKAVGNEAKEAAEYAVRLGKGETLSEITEYTDDGSYQIPSRILMPWSVTSENMDEVVIDGGYHRREDVYLNVRQSNKDE